MKRSAPRDALPPSNRRHQEHSHRRHQGHQGHQGGPEDKRPNPSGVVRQKWVRLSERVTLQAGDRVRVSGGPYWEQTAPDGSVTKTRMSERGVMVFEEYCELGQSRWIVARGQDGYAALHLGPEEQSADVPGLVRRPYKLRWIRPGKARRGTNPASVVARAKSSGRSRPAHRGAAP
jgi:hypothetical protein